MGTILSGLAAQDKRNTISFHLEGFWYHVNKETGRDQNGDKWYCKGGYLVHEHQALKIEWSKVELKN